MPSYLRRSAITHALGAYHRTGRLCSGGRGRKGRPCPRERTHQCLCFGNMYREGEGTQPCSSYNRTGCGSGQPSFTQHGVPEKHWTGVRHQPRPWRKRTGSTSCGSRMRRAGNSLTGRYRSEDLRGGRGSIRTRCGIMEADGTVCARKFIGFADEKTVSGAERIGRRAGARPEECGEP